MVLYLVYLLTNSALSNANHELTSKDDVDMPKTRSNNANGGVNLIQDDAIFRQTFKEFPPIKRSSFGSKCVSCLTRKGFMERIEKLGITNRPGIKLETVSKEMVRKLKQNVARNASNDMNQGQNYFSSDNEMSIRKKGKMLKHALENGFVGDEDDPSAAQKRASHAVCPEKIEVLPVLAHEAEQLVYKIETRVCEGKSCQSMFGSFGSCIGVKANIVVYVMGDSNRLVPKTVEYTTCCKCFSGP